MGEDDSWDSIAMNWSRILLVNWKLIWLTSLTWYKQRLVTIRVVNTMN